MEADQPLRIVQSAREHFEGNAGSVGGEQGACFHAGFEGGVETALGFGILVDGLDDHVGGGDALTPVIGNEAVPCLLFPVAVAQTLAKEFVGPFNRARQLFRGAVLQCHPQTPEHAPGGDVASHHPAAHHVDPPGMEAIVGRQSLEPVLQQEHADEVLCGAAGEQLRHRGGFAAVHFGTVSGGAAPVIDETVWGG